VVPQLSGGWQVTIQPKQGKQAAPISNLCILLCLWGHITKLGQSTFLRYL
jgi:hypothetical protein